MFVNKNKLKTEQVEEGDNPFVGEKKYDTSKDKNFAFIILAMIIVVAAAAAIFLFLSKRPGSGSGSGSGRQSSGSDEQNSSLPGQVGTSSLNGFGGENGGDDIRAEYISFGDYYKEPKYDTLSDYSGKELPIDIKNEVSNYFYITRKFSLDNYLKGLNEDGFVVIDNVFSKEADDFFSIYRLLAERQMPSILTSDFILYYFQNELKNVYQEIEKNVFYDNLWKVYKEIYDVALARYKNSASTLGMANSTILEAQRQEVTYLAVMLQTLKPTGSQISGQGGLLDLNKFSENEAYEYNFSMPDEIKKEAEKEIKLLRGASGVIKSPTFFRNIDYSNYKIPAHYSGNAKLNNFYLAIKWLQTPWPLFYEGEDCFDCELDYRDWLISMAAGAYLANDLAYDQELKNRWATIYKFVSFFTGLEKDLTYLDYYNVYKDLFGEEFSIDDIFSDDNVDREVQLSRTQDKLASLTWGGLHGGKKRDQSENRLIGMRLLQDFYWPNNYLLNELVGYDFTINRQDVSQSIKNTCPNKDLDTAYRCKGSGFDVVNILHDYEETPGKYAYNNLFAGYNNRVKDLRTDLLSFSLHEWHETVYWTTLHLISQYLDYDSSVYPEYSRSSRWREERDLNTVMGGWVNLHVPEDVLEFTTEQTVGSFNSGPGCDRYNIIETRPDMIDALIAKSDMLIDVLTALGINKKTSVATIQLKEMNSTLLSLKTIMLKMQKKEDLDGEDCKVMKNFATQYKLVSTAKKSFSVNFDGKNTLNVSNSGNKIMLLVYVAQGDLVVGFAPIFNYIEN